MGWKDFLPSIIAVIVSFLLSSAFTIYREKRKNDGVRNIGISALNLFISYAKLDNTFKSTEPEFNNVFTIPEKRAVLVALHKIGVPITIPSTGLFDISKI